MFQLILITFAKKERKKQNSRCVKNRHLYSRNGKFIQMPTSQSSKMPPYQAIIEKENCFSSSLRHSVDLKQISSLCWTYVYDTEMNRRQWLPRNQGINTSAWGMFCKCQVVVLKKRKERKKKKIQAHLFGFLNLRSYPDTSSCPSEEYAQQRTGADWPVSVWRSCILYAVGENSSCSNTRKNEIFTLMSRWRQKQKIRLFQERDPIV